MREQLRITLSYDLKEALNAAAAKKDISPGILARMILNERFEQPDTESKTYTIRAKNWREIEAYVEAKQLGSVEVFAAFAMKQYLTKYPLTDGQRKQIEKSIGITGIPPLGCTA